MTYDLSHQTPDIDEVIRAKDAVVAEFLSRPGVTGVGAGFKYVNGQRTDEYSVVVFVARKKKELVKEQVIPRVVHGIKTDVVEANCRLCSSLHTEGLNKNPGQRITTVIRDVPYHSTFGAAVKDRQSGQLMGLTTWHHLPRVGDRVETNPDGKVVRFRYDEQVDAGVFSIPVSDIDGSISGLGYVHGKATARLGMPVVKCGGITGVTRGEVTGIACDIPAGEGDHRLTFRNVIKVSSLDGARILKMGDSGALAMWEIQSGPTRLHTERYAIGLVFAGNDEPPVDTIAWLIPIDRVERALNVWLITRPYRPPDRPIPLPLPASLFEHVMKTQARGIGFVATPGGILKPLAPSEIYLESGENVSEVVREILSALAIGEMAALINEPHARDQITCAAFELVARKAKQMIRDAEHEKNAEGESEVAQETNSR